MSKKAKKANVKKVAVKKKTHDHGLENDLLLVAGGGFVLIIIIMLLLGKF